MKCIEKCRAIKSPCSEKNCRMWINYEEDLKFRASKADRGQGSW